MAVADASSDSKTVTPEVHGERITQPKYTSDSEFITEVQNVIEEQISHRSSTEALLN